MTSYTIGGCTYTPYSVGFETVFTRLNNQFETKSQQTYPPHNIIKVSDENYLIELAVAGLKEEDIDISVKDEVLSIVYDTVDEKKENKEYMHRGISARKFRKEFTLAEYVKVDSANLENGILTISLTKVIPEEMKPRKITINGAKATKKEFIAD